MDHQTEVVLEMSGDEKSMAGILLGLPAHDSHPVRFVEEAFRVECGPFRRVHQISCRTRNDLNRDATGFASDHRLALPERFRDRQPESLSRGLLEHDRRSLL